MFLQEPYGVLFKGVIMPKLIKQTPALVDFKLKEDGCECSFLQKPGRVWIDQIIRLLWGGENSPKY